MWPLTVSTSTNKKTPRTTLRFSRELASHHKMSYYNFNITNINTLGSSVYLQRTRSLSFPLLSSSMIRPFYSSTHSAGSLSVGSGPASLVVVAVAVGTTVVVVLVIIVMVGHTHPWPATDASGGASHVE